MGPKLNDMCSIRDADRRDYTQKRRRQCGYRGRDWRNVATSQELPRIAGSLQKLEEARKVLLRAFKGSRGLLTL